jgi:hypothetical protein
LHPERILSPFVLSLLLRTSFLSQILFERKTRKTSLQGIDRLVIAGRKHQAPTVFVKDYGRAFF